jgi:glycosyltransferase involved in cell wall biosynthesis
LLAHLNAKLHLLFLSAEYPPAPGGIGDYTQQLAQALAALGHRISVITIQQGQLRRYTAHSDASEVLAPAAGWGWSSWPLLRTTITQLAPDIVDIQYQTGAYAMHPAINLLPWYLRRLSVPIVVTFHDLLEPYLFPKAGPLRRWITTRLAADADAVIVTNSVDHDTLVGRLPHKGDALNRLAVIPIGSNIPLVSPQPYDRDQWRAGIGCGPADLLVAYFGLLSPGKGADLLLEALVDLPARLLIIGGEATAPQDQAFARQWVQQVERLGLTNRLIRTGHLAPAQVSAHLLAADIVALPFRDGASFRRGSLLAALAHGCPVVTTHPTDPATARLLRHDEEAFLIKPNDATSLRQALRHLATDQPLRKRLALGGQRLAEAFAWPAIARQHQQLYLSLLEG